MEGAANADKCITKCAHILPESTNAKISGSNAQPEGDKVFFPPTCLDVFLFTLPSPGYRLIMPVLLACGQSWSVLEVRKLLKS